LLCIGEHQVVRKAYFLREYNPHFSSAGNGRPTVTAAEAYKLHEVGSANPIIGRDCSVQT
jgi:hypothetical protein